MSDGRACSRPTTGRGRLRLRAVDIPGDQVMDMRLVTPTIKP